jgi:hypothetical protein
LSTSTTCLADPDPYSPLAGEDGARWFFRKLVREKKANTIVPDSPKKAARTIRTQHGNEGFALVKARSPMARNATAGRRRWANW